MDWDKKVPAIKTWTWACRFKNGFEILHIGNCENKKVVHSKSCYKIRKIRILYLLETGTTYMYVNVAKATVAPVY